MITLLNLLCGCISIVFSASGNFEMAGCLIFVAAVFDFFDGFTARLLKISSPMGIQLDSLSDMVSFGVAPSMMLFYINLYKLSPASVGIWILAGIPFLLALFSALRLAKFNIDTRQTESFIGLTTTACAVFIASAMMYGQHHFTAFINNTYTIAVASIVLSLLLIAEIPMFSLKMKGLFKDGKFNKKYRIQLFFIPTVMILIILFRLGGIAISALLYIIISIIICLLSSKKEK